MIESKTAILIGFIAIIIYLLVALLFLKAKPMRIVLSCLFIAYLTGVAIVTLFPIPIDGCATEYYEDITWYNFIPFKTISGTFSDGITSTALVQILGNIALSVPFGVFILFFTRNHKWWKLLIFAFSLTLTIELTQMIIGFAVNNMYRNVDIDDVILNVAGAYIGYGIYKLLPSCIKKT